MRSARHEGVAGLARLIADIAVRLPIEYLAELRGDVRYALRALGNAPGFAFVGIVSTGIGMGLTTAVYSSKWQLVSRQLAVASPERLVMPEKPVSYHDVEAYRKQNALFTGAAAFQPGVVFNVRLGNAASAKPERVVGQIVSPDYFTVLGVRPQVGRVLDPAQDRPGDAPAVVISDRFWRNRLDAAGDVVGRSLRVNGQLVTVVGVAPKDFNGVLPVTPSELFVPLTVSPAVAPELAGDVLHQRDARHFLGLMRLAPGADAGVVEGVLADVNRRLAAEATSLRARADTARRVPLLAAGGMVPLPREVKPLLTAFFAMLMGLIMTIACMNLGTMLVARGAHRRRELAIRLSVGASRFRLVRQLMCEGVVLSLLGGVLGFALSSALVTLRLKFTAPTALPIEDTLRPGWSAAWFAFALALSCGVLFSLAPALRATKADFTPALKDGSGLQLPGHRRIGLRNLLIVAQVAGSLALLMITGFLVLGLSQASDVGTRIDPRRTFLLAIDPARDGYTPERGEALVEELLRRLRGVPGVRGVALATQPPYAEEDEDAAVQVTSNGAQDGSRLQVPANEIRVGSAYFSVLNEPVLAGREFTDIDLRESGNGARPVPVILNEGAAGKLFPFRNAIGGHLNDGAHTYEVVGIVRDQRNGLRLVSSMLYLPLTRRTVARPPAGGITIVVQGDAASTFGSVRREIEAVDPNLSTFDVRTLDEYLRQSRASQQYALQTYGGIGVFSLVLAALGLAGVTAYAVAQRRREIGIRVALGARTSQVLFLVLREAVALVSVGTILGLAGAIGMARILAALANVFVRALSVGTGDPRLLLGAPTLLAALALVACAIPALRATRVDPLTALRQN